MDTYTKLLPGQRLSRHGRPRLDYAAVAALAFPFMLNSAMQAVLNATDTWFIGRLSPAATAAIGAVYWPVLVFVLLFGGVGLSVQTLVAQAYGAGRLARASQATWTAIWASIFTLPLFVALSVAGPWLFSPFGIPDGTLRLALDYWSPRMLGGPLGIALWSILGFFNGVGRPLVTLRVTAAVAVANALLNQLFVIELGLGIAGSAWATGAAQMLGVALALAAFLSRPIRARFRSHLTTRLRLRPLVGQIKLGFPMGVLTAADIMGFALFQLMQVRLGTVDGASTQIVMMLTSFCYMPAVGIAMAGTTLVGQAIGAGTPEWAARAGNGIIVIAMVYMGMSGLLLAAAGPWLMPLFTNSSEADASLVAALGCRLLWIAAGYQVFDGLSLCSGACLRGAGDVGVPSLMVIALSWGFFVPLAHSLSFGTGAGWVGWLPQFGFGAVGGWFAALAYMCGLGVTLFLRWRSGAWRRVVLPLMAMLVTMTAAALMSAPAFAAAPAYAGATPPAVPAPVAQIIKAQHLPPGAVSFVILDPNDGGLVAGLGVDTPRSPASTVKVVTTFASLDLLGPAYVWHTRALVHGDVIDGVLQGDLILQGGGDPYMTLERWWSFAGSLRAKGLKSIHGDIVIDDSAFALPAEDPAEFDGRPNRSYNVVPDALMVNFQSVEFRVAPDAKMHRVDVTATPSPANLVIENHIRLASGRCRAAANRVDLEIASPRWDRVVLSGALSPSCAPRSFARVLLRPADYAFGTFLSLWRELGGGFDGHLRIERAPADAEVYASFDSLSVADVVRLTNKYSSNLMARHLLLTLGSERFGPPATPDKGAAALLDWSRERGLPLQGVAIDNGSGLSRTTQISVSQMAAVLVAAYHSRYAPEFMASLPLAGIDGTLRSRMKTAAAGSVRLKTGHLDGVSGVAGYVTTPAGKTFVLVCLVNDARADSGAAEPVHAGLVNWIQTNL